MWPVYLRWKHPRHMLMLVLKFRLLCATFSSSPSIEIKGCEVRLEAGYYWTFGM